MPIWLTWLIEGAGSLFRALVGAKQASVADEAGRAATAETQLHEEQSANDVITQGAAARAGADRHQLQPGNGDPAAVTVDPAAPVNTSPDAHFRD